MWCNLLQCVRESLSMFSWFMLITHSWKHAQMVMHKLFNLLCEERLVNKKQQKIYIYLSHRTEKWNDKPLESHGLQLRGQRYHVGALSVSKDVCTGCEERGCRGREQQQVPHSTKETLQTVKLFLENLFSQDFNSCKTLALLLWTALDICHGCDWKLNQAHLL